MVIQRNPNNIGDI